MTIIVKSSHSLSDTPTLGGVLILSRCPHCKIARPNLTLTNDFKFNTDNRNQEKRTWAVYSCSMCGGLIVASALGHKADHGAPVTDVYPSDDKVSTDIPEPARTYLSDAIDSPPSGAVMLAASCVDAMLKTKGYTEGYLYPRIQQAVKDHLITEEMGVWAHEVRLDANNSRHADEAAPLPNSAEADKAVAFARALGDFLFVLPARVVRGRAKPAS